MTEFSVVHDYNEGMGVAYNNEFGEWLADLMRERGITSSRQVRQRTGVSHTTIDDILKGTRPGLETAIKIATGFKMSISRALHLAGYDEIVAVWEAEDNVRTHSLERQEDDETTGEYHPDDVPPDLQMVYGLQGKVVKTLPPGRARDRYVAALRARAEADWALIEEREEGSQE